MKYLLTEAVVKIPSDITLSCNNKVVEVKGKLGVVKKDFRHVSCDIQQITEGKDKAAEKKLRIQMWLAKRRQRCQVRAVASQISNMIRGVTVGYKYKMKFAYAHFPIQAIVTDNGAVVEIKNFLGEKVTRKIDCLPGVKCTRTEEDKNTLTFTGNDLNNVSLTCALVHQSCLVKNKDIRQFLDGIYVSDKRLEINDP